MFKAHDMTKAASKKRAQSESRRAAPEVLSLPQILSLPNGLQVVSVVEWSNGPPEALSLSNGRDFELLIMAFVPTAP